MKGYRFRVEPTWLYYIRSGDDGPIKIGLANDPWLRMSQMQTGNPEELQMLAVESAHVPREAERHLQFAADRLRGEWFRPSERLYALIEQVRQRNFIDAILTFPERFDPDLAREYREAADAIVAEGELVA